LTDGPGISDGDLVRLARDGDPVAFRLLVERHQPMVRARAAGLCANASDVDDIMQEAFLQAFIALDRLREPDRFAGWLAGIVLNVCRGLRRRDQVTLLPDSPEPPPASAFPAQPAPSDGQPSADDLDRADALREAMATLTAGQRRAVFLHYYAGLPAGQIGDQAGAARVSLHKARRRLREYLTEHRPDLVPRRPMTTVRIASVEHQRRRVHQTRSPSYVVVLIDDAGGRELPVWMLRGDGDRLERLVHAERGEASAPARTADDLSSRMLRAIGAAVTGVDIVELGPEVTAARIVLNGPADSRQVTARLADGLAVAITTGAPIRVADAVMDRLAVPAGSASVPEPVLSPDVPAGSGGTASTRSTDRAEGPRRPPRRPRPRYEPRNMTFSEGLEGWLFGGSFTEHASESHWHDYICAVEHGTAVVRSAVPEPAGIAFLGQEVFADDLLGSTVVFRGEFRVQARTPGRAGLFLRVNEGHDITGPMTERSVFADPDNNITPIPDTGDWAWQEVTAQVPGDTDAVVLGIFLAAAGRIELRNPELIRRYPASPPASSSLRPTARLRFAW
jgi:RNA polymerase sigma-70 factor (ECF subfamily)